LTKRWVTAVREEVVLISSSSVDWAAAPTIVGAGALQIPEWCLALVCERRIAQLNRTRMGGDAGAMRIPRVSRGA
jgi:hypothetical protein